MGQHTWFYKSKDKYYEAEKLYDKLDKYENGLIGLDATELFQIEAQADDIEDENDASEYHDIFRTSKRTANGAYTNDVLTSLSETLEWISNEENLVYYGIPNDGNNDEKKKYAIKRIHDFWDKYPEGLIGFG